MILISQTSCHNKQVTVGIQISHCSCGHHMVILADLYIMNCSIFSCHRNIKTANKTSSSSVMIGYVSLSIHFKIIYFNPSEAEGIASAVFVSSQYRCFNYINSSTDPFHSPDKTSLGLMKVFMNEEQLIF